MKHNRPMKGQCRPRVCTFEIPASVEASWRQGDKQALVDALVAEVKQLGAQVGLDYDEQMKPSKLTLDRSVQ